MPLLISVSCFAAGSKPPARRDVTEVHKIEGLMAKRQETNSWCWASAVQMVLSQNLQNRTPSQCEIVTVALNHNCCATPTPLKCLQGQMPSAVLRSYGLNVKTFAGTNFESVRSEILQGRPAIIITDPAGSQHAMVAYGTYIGKNGQDYLIVWDPFTGRSSSSKRSSASWDAVILAN